MTNQTPYLAIPALVAAFYLTRTIYRLYFHPLSKFPGPKLTAATGLVEIYYDVIRGGKFLWEIEKMHEKYGPIVRITPHEIHIKDSSYYDSIYTNSKKLSKDPNFVGLFGSPQSMIATIDHAHHRFRRGILASFFSKRSITTLTPVIKGKILRLMERLHGFHQTDKNSSKNNSQNNKAVDLSAAFAALTADIITYYSYGESFGFLDSESFRSEVRAAIMETEELDHITRLFPFVLAVMRRAPSWVFEFVKPATAVVAMIQRTVAERSARAIHSQTRSRSAESKAENGKAGGISYGMFDALTDPGLPDQERTLSRIHDEGMILLSGGMEPAANALTVAAFHIINNKEIMAKMRAELGAGVMDRGGTLAQLERLPYLTGVVNEALRLSHGLVIRSPRVSPTEALMYKGYSIPAGTPVAMSSYFVHMDPTLFPDPTVFNPDRWIEATKRGYNLTRFITAFSKGTRQCVGINLSYAELYLTLAYFATFFDYELHETTEENVTVARDRGVPFPEKGHLMVKAKVIKVLRDPYAV
ncbi:cytochrome P450 [Aspergillus puulaauensis]|uniref:Cytochrome P450 n=1 Tax=Aspergillus puulaauensis TaxID=1220207 RepID=A0A7R7X9Q2_9EURO|nr:uncharacterized protein APUU_10174S [Aspergillus puulaauensis]BCS17346.1 hypothetical protein APUU_10174S [Aspergillus puulaauensis]